MATAVSDSQLSKKNHRTTAMEGLKAHLTRSSGSGRCPPPRPDRHHSAAMSAWEARSAGNPAVFVAHTFSATAVVTN